MRIDGDGAGGALVLRVERDSTADWAPPLEHLNKLTARVRMVLMARVSILS